MGGCFRSLFLWDLKMKVMIDGVEYRPCAPNNIGNEALSTALRNRRKYFGWTLDEAAKKIGCTKSYVHSIEKGVGEPSLRMAFRISNAYDMPLKQIAIALDVNELVQEASK
jgi:DNA-binding XRE family transcriptional regulator